jgi:Polyketide cyclase / dehydrase and lipid transport
MINGTATLSPLAPSTSIGHSVDYAQLLKGDILLETEPYASGGGAVTARMYLPVERTDVWQHVTDYPRWVQYFPALTHSEVLPSISGNKGGKRLYQVASKAFLMLTAQVEIHLRVFERTHQTVGHQIQFCFEKGSFTDFSADLTLRDLQGGTLLTYSVRATPKIWVPSVLIQEAMRLDLPHNLRRMRQVIEDCFR